MRIYLPSSANQVGGGWTFLRNLRKGLEAKGHEVFSDIVSSFERVDVALISGVTMVERDLVEQLHAHEIPIVFRMDNIPRKSRNKRNRVYDNIKRYSEIAKAVVYQSEWAREYCMPMSGPGRIIVNGVDTKVFYPALEKPDHPIVLFAYHGKSELKGFWQAHYHFQMFARAYRDAEFWFIYNFKSELHEQIEANFDFWNGERFQYLMPVKTDKEMADLMRRCTHFFYPSVADAAPNVVLEARACGLEVMHLSDDSGSYEMMDPGLDISLERMTNEYINLFEEVLA